MKIKLIRLNIVKSILMLAIIVSFSSKVVGAVSDPWYEEWLKLDPKLKEEVEKTRKAVEKEAEDVRRGVIGIAEDVRKLVEKESMIVRLKIEYDDSIRKVQDLTQKDIKKLTSVSPWNKNLVWNKEKTHIRMVSWIPKWAVDAFYQKSLGKDFTTPEFEGVYMWVTVVPQVKDFARQYLQTEKSKELPVNYRLQQYFGLPPQDSTYFFVEIWVKPKDLFRPCPDSEVIDDQCVFDPAKNELPGTFSEIFNFVKADQKYQDWYKKRKATVYGGKYPFPWTALGYTYDWGNRDNIFGVSEFAVKQGKKVFIDSITPTDQYR